MAETSDSPDVYTILRQWDEENQMPNYDPIPMLTRLSELIESETEAYMKMDPDPFDERHPSRAYPTCSLGHTLKVLFRKEQFMTRLVNDYLRDNYYSRLGITGRDVRKLNIAACRLMLDITPGLETAAVFEMPTNDVLLQRLFSWAEKSVEPLQSYATGLLAAAMEVQEIAVGFREQNIRLVPLMLERLHNLQTEAVEERNASLARPFAHLGNSDGEMTQNGKKDWCRQVNINAHKSPHKIDEEILGDKIALKINGSICKKDEDFHSSNIENRRESVEGIMSPPLKPSPFNVSDCSNSSWAEMETYVIGNVQMHPLTLATKQMFILKYLTPMGEYQEFLSHVFEKNALDLIMQFINLRETKNSRLSFEALKYLAALLCHKKFSIEFINMGGLQRLLEVPRPSIAATGVSICLYYLAYCEDAMERVCVLPHHVLSNLVRYALWLLECSHDSGRCHATMFFGLSFQFRIILEEFDAQDGLRKLYNVISTLPILAVDEAPMNEDEECSARQIVRHVCVALKKYLEAHLYIRSEQVRRAHVRDSIENSKLHSALPSYKACKSSPEEVREQINTLLEYMSYRAQWLPVDNFLRLGGVSLLLQVIGFAYEWNYSGRSETVRCALDVLSICAVMPRAQVHLCEKVGMPDDSVATGINVLLGAAEGEVVNDPDVQRAALHVLITCVCAPIYRVGGLVGRYSTGGSTKKRTHSLRSSEEVIEKIWETFRTTNGIMVLLGLIQLKTPITDADSIRGLACQALAGLARSETVRQIISKLPLFTSGQLQNLMKDPILQDRRQEHVTFQKYALELLERVSGKSKPKNELEPSLTNIHKANVVAQTRIQFNDRELMQLIYQHLQSHGMVKSAEILQKEASLPQTKPSQPLVALSPFTYQRATSTPARGRPVAKLPVVESPSSLKSTPVLHQPIKLNITTGGQKKHEVKTPLPISKSLEKKISYEPTEKLPHSKEMHVTLDSIITEYLTNQHALCKNPMATCPQFNLFEPHKCPDPKVRNRVPNNFAMRHSRGIISNRLNHRLMHSRFCCVHIFRYGDDNAFFTCCDFFNSDKSVVIGTHQGEVKLFNLHSGTEVASHHCHETYISHLQCARSSSLLLTSSTWGRNLSSCWQVNDNIFYHLFSMDEEEYVEFSKLSEDKLIGTKGEIATIYDIQTKKLIQTLKPTISNQYNKNRATFSPTNELVLSDGVLWDVNSGKQIHKLDKLNQTLSGVFHPNGLEVVSNTEVWDLRTFHLLRTVPALDHCDVLFSPTGYTLYSIAIEKETDDDDAQYENSFKTLDAYDYSSIATIDVKKNIYDLACNSHDTQIALVENQGIYESVDESIVKIYDVGRSRTTDDEPEEEEEDDDMEGSSGSDDDQHVDSIPHELSELLEEVSSNNSVQSDDEAAAVNNVNNRGDNNGGDDDDDDDDDEDEDNVTNNEDEMSESDSDSDSDYYI
ncbi:lisH and WD40 domain-containing protein mahjong [Rhodnius prolixus]|uniref:lisH and WD40 domain-containing protein mahjong n=1 Tax=Rhodnius prolixus TaxID=13249 RepID=UPI003D187F28